MCAHLAHSSKYDRWTVNVDLTFRVPKSAYVYGDGEDQRIMGAMNVAHGIADAIEAGFGGNIVVTLGEDYRDEEKNEQDEVQGDKSGSRWPDEVLPEDTQ